MPWSNKEKRIAMLRQPVNRIAEGATQSKCAGQRHSLGSARSAMAKVPIVGVREGFRFARRQPATMESRNIGAGVSRPPAPSRPAQSAAQSRRRFCGARFLARAVRRGLPECVKSLRFGRVRTIRSKTEALGTSACLHRPMTDLNSIGEPPIASDSGRPPRRPEVGLESGGSGMRFGPESIPSGDSGSA